MATRIMAKKTSTIDRLFASWNDLEEEVDVEMSANQPTRKLTKAHVKLHFTIHDLPPIACHRLPAACIPKAITDMNSSRNNPELFQYFIGNDPYWLAQRILLQAQFQSGVRLARCQTYLLAEQGEPVVRVNGRPLTDSERALLDLDDRAVDLSHTLPVDKQMKKDTEMILPEYTLYCIVAMEDSLVTTGCILPRGRQGTYEESGDDDDDDDVSTKISSTSSGVDDGLSSPISGLQLEDMTEGVHEERRLGDGLELCIFASGIGGEDEECLTHYTSW